MSYTGPNKAMLHDYDGSKPDNVEIDAGAFRPDWIAIWTANEAERELSQPDKPFEFKGPGFYLTKIRTSGAVETLLVLPLYNPSEPKRNASLLDMYLFCVYSHDLAIPAFNWIVNAPVRVDER